MTSSSPHKSFLDRYDAGEFDRIETKSDADDHDVEQVNGPDEEDEDQDLDWPSAPPISFFDSLRGYESVSFSACSVPPPLTSFPVITQLHPAPKELDLSVPEVVPEAVPAEVPPPKPIVLESSCRISQEQAKLALLNHVSNQCCWGKSPIRNMVIQKMDSLPGLHYELQTFTERRETAWSYAPIKSNLRDFTNDLYLNSALSPGGVPPLPWDIDQAPAELFKDEIRQVVVPNTTSTKTCHRCRGSGLVRCRECSGRGWNRCIHCHGEGWMPEVSLKERCIFCHHSRHGHGQADCEKCHARGKVSCSICLGEGQIRFSLSESLQAMIADQMCSFFQVLYSTDHHLEGAHPGTHCGKARPAYGVDQGRVWRGGL